MEADPADWNTRLQIASLLYDREVFPEASALIWEADRIPCTALDLALAACILAKDQPGKAIRLLTAVLETNRGKAAQNMGMANALLHHGMVLQSARFYGAALEINPKLVNLEFEHFFIWADDEQRLWGNFQGHRPQLHELPWMTRDPLEASELSRDVSRHTTPIAVPRLNQGKVEASATEALREKLTENPGDWDTRRTLAQLLHDQGAYGEAAVLIWDSDPIPSIDLDIAFAARALAREGPRKAIRLLTAVLEQNRGKAVQNMGMANALLHYGMVLESARFYGAALDADPNLVNPDLEHFLLWTDDAKSLWENFLKIRPPLGIFPWAQSDTTLHFGADFSTPPLRLSALSPVQGENLTNPLYQQLARKSARITPPPAVTFPADRVALNDHRPDFGSGAANGQEQIAGRETDEEAAAKATAAARRLAEEQAAAEAKAAALFAEAAESARTLIEQARQEATTEVAAIRAKAREELQAALEQARQNTEQEMAAIRAKAREEAEAAAGTVRKEAEFQAALARAKAEEIAAEAEAAAQLRAEENARAFALAKQRTEEEERAAAAAKRLAEEQANAAAEQAAEAKAAAEKARQEATSEMAAMRAKAEEELKAAIEQARQNSEQELAAIRAKAREEAENEATLIRIKAEEEARAAEKARLEAAAQAEAAAQLRAEENTRALALAKQRAEEEERSTAAAQRLAEEQARAAAEKMRQEAAAEVSALRAKAEDELKTAIEQARRNTDQELAAIRAKADEDAKNAAAAAEQARLEAAQAAAEILARAEEEAKALALAKQRKEQEEQALAVRKRAAEEQAQAAAEQARQEALAELAAIKAQTQEELKAATEKARLDSEQELTMLRAKAREEAKALMENAAKEAASGVALSARNSEEDAKFESRTAECAPSEAVASAAAVATARVEHERAVPVAGPIAKKRYGKRRFCVLLVSAAIAMGCWKFLPGSDADRALFSTVAGSFANPPLFVTGQGIPADPWKLNSMTSGAKPDKREAPLVISLGDDVGGFFQSSPPAPIDLAVIFSNIQRLGAKKAASAAVLAWESPDTIGLAALDKALAKFDSLVMAAPLSRGSVPLPLPSAFRRGSLPLTAVSGDASALPVVNRIPIPGVILGGEKSVAGFTTLESELSAAGPPLLARWDDRVVFAFPLLIVLQRNNFPLDGMEIRLGEYLKLSADGPIIPLDADGRLAAPLKSIAGFAEISAENLIDGGDDLFPKTAPEPVVLRDDQSAADPATRAYSQKLSAMVASIGSREAFSRSDAYRRLPENWEAGILGSLVLAVTLFCGQAEFRRHVIFGVLAGVWVVAQWLAAGLASVWLPGIAAFATISAAVIVAKLIRGTAAKPLRESLAPEEPEAVLESPPAPQPAPEETTAAAPVAEEMPPAKKATVSKVPAKKVPGKRAAPRKKK